MKQTLKKSFLWALVFLGTIVFWWLSYATWINLNIVESWDTLTSTLWNEVVWKINEIWAKTDGIFTDGSWNVWIWTTTPTQKLDVNGNIKGDVFSVAWVGSIWFSTNNILYLRSKGIYVSGWSWIDLHNTDHATYPNYITLYPWSSTNPWNVYIPYWNIWIWNISPSYKLHVNGSVAGTSWTTTSDERYKKDIKTLSGALDKINQLRWVEYSWKQEEFEEKEFDDKKHVGFIAQEVEKVLPELVTTDDEWYKWVEYANITAVLVEALKEQQEQIETLKEQNNNLLERIEVLENK